MANSKNVAIPADLHALLLERQKKTGIPLTRQVADAIRALLGRGMKREGKGAK